jgi:predicted aspartyl protease
MGEILTQYNSNTTDSVELASSGRPSGGSGASGSGSGSASTSGTTPSGSSGNVVGGNDLNMGGSSSNVTSHSHPMHQPSQVSERSYKLDPNTKKFNGKGDVRMWVFSMNEALNVAKAPDDLKLSLILPYLEGLPLTFLFNYRKNNIDGNWLDFSRLLIEHFEPLNRKQLARNELRALKHEGDFEVFKLKFLSLLNIVDDITTESSKIDTFLNCLKRGTAFEVQKSLPKTLDDAGRLATIYEQSRAQFRLELNTPAPSIKKLNKISLGRGNKARKIKRYHEKKHKIRSSACYNCGEEGHIKKDCPNKKVNAISDESRNKYKDKNKAFKTKTINQVDINVINLVDAERSGNNLLSVTGKIKNMKVKCLLDTGAIVSTISRRMANKLNLSKHDTSIKIRTAENNVSQALGVVKNVVIDIRDHKCKISELVILDNDYDIILGINYFKAMSAGVIFKNNKTFLKFFKNETDESDSNDEDDKSKVNDPDDIELFLINDKDPNSIIDTEYLDENDFDQDYWEFPKKSEFFEEKAIKPDSNLEPEENEIFYRVIAPIARGLIPNNELDLTGCTTGEPHKILMDKSHPPIHIKQYRYSEVEKAQIKKEVYLLYEAGIIQPSRSAWAFPLVKVLKPDGTIRLCTDFRRLNKLITPEPWPLPKVEDIVEKASKGTWHTKIDLKSRLYGL